MYQARGDLEYFTYDGGGGKTGAETHTDMPRKNHQPSDEYRHPCYPDTFSKVKEFKTVLDFQRVCKVH